MRESTKTYKNSTELARAFNEAEIPSNYYELSDKTIDKFWDQGLRTWGATTDFGTVVLTHDGSRWHTLYTARGLTRGWIPSSLSATSPARITQNYTSYATVADFIKGIKASYSHLPDPDKEGTGTVHFKDSQDFADALRRAGIGTGRYDNEIFRAPNVSTWSVAVGSDAKAIIAFDGKDWHMAYTVYDSEWVGSLGYHQLRNPNPQRGYSTIREYRDYLRRSRTDLLPKEETPVNIDRTTGPWATTEEFCDALNHVKVDPGTAYYDTMKPFWKNGFIDWTIQGNGGRYMVAHDGTRWHHVYSVSGGSWIEVSENALDRLDSPNYPTAGEFFAAIKRVFRGETKVETVPVRIDFLSMDEGITAHIDKPFDFRKHYEYLAAAIAGVTQEFTTRGYTFDFSSTTWDGSFFVGEATKDAKPDPLDVLTYAGVPVKGLSANTLARTLNRSGWDGNDLPRRAKVPLFGNEGWRVQVAYDDDGDPNIFVHNGTEWVGAYYEGGYWVEWVEGPAQLTKEQPVKPQYEATADYLKKFEPANV